MGMKFLLFSRAVSIPKNYEMLFTNTVIFKRNQLIPGQNTIGPAKMNGVMILESQIQYSLFSVATKVPHVADPAQFLQRNAIKEN